MTAADPVGPPGDAGGPASEELVERIVRGDADAEARLVGRYARGVRMIVSRGTRDRAAVDDLCQETLRIALEKIRAGDVRDARRLPGFICAIARNLAIDHARRASRAA